MQKSTENDNVAPEAQQATDEKRRHKTFMERFGGTAIAIGMALALLLLLVLNMR